MLFIKKMFRVLGNLQVRSMSSPLLWFPGSLYLGVNCSGTVKLRQFSSIFRSEKSKSAVVGRWKCYWGKYWWLKNVFFLGNESCTTRKPVFNYHFQSYGYCKGNAVKGWSQFRHKVQSPVSNNLSESVWDDDSMATTLTNQTSLLSGH